ncbi:MAG: HD domain-containing protein [Armatimonadota bacterium]
MRAHLVAIAEEWLADAGGGHGLDHTRRVVALALRLADSYPAADIEVLEAAAWLHDVGHPDEDRTGIPHEQASVTAAEPLLPGLGFAQDRARQVLAAIAAHRFSRGHVPETLEGKLLQDADRLDALGAIGIARTFANSATRKLYDSEDPFAEYRPLNDRQYTLDHFFTKLLKLPATLHTPEARALAEHRIAYMKGFLRQLGVEIGCDRPETA